MSMTPGVIHPSEKPRRRRRTTEEEEEEVQLIGFQIEIGGRDVV
jgi:hypothetical protein